MNVLKLESGDPVEPKICECCSQKSYTVTGFIYNDDHAHGVYFANWTEKHVPAEVVLTICIGEWGDGGNPKNRDTINLRIRGKEYGYGMMITDASESPWNGAPIFGNFMDREKAINSIHKSEILRIAEKVILEVPEISEYLA